MTDPDPDLELLRRSASGDTAAFEEFVARHERSVYRLLRAKTSDPADAEDALQDTFLAAWRGAAGFEGRGSPRAWILTIARNALGRQQRRRPGEPADFVSLDDLGVRAGWGLEVADDAAMAGLEDRVVLERTLQRLPEDDREVLVLRDLEGFSGEEVARMMGLSLPAMKSRLHRARLRLTAALRGERHAGT